MRRVDPRTKIRVLGAFAVAVFLAAVSTAATAPADGRHAVVLDAAPAPGIAADGSAPASKDPAQAGADAPVSSGDSTGDVADDAAVTGGVAPVPPLSAGTSGDRGKRAASTGSASKPKPSPSRPGSAADRQAALPVLGGAVTLTGNRAGYVRVRLPKQAFFDRADVGAKDSLVISGGGDMAAFALMREAGRGADIKGPVVVGGHTRRSADVTKRRGEFALTLLRVAPDDEQNGAVLPAGTYGKPTTVRLKLRGLSGSSQLTPQVRTPVVVQGGSPRIAREDSNGVLYSEGYETDLAEQSLHFSVSVARNRAHVATSSWDCLFDHKPEGPDPYLPGCPSFGEGNALASHFVYADQSVTPGELTSYGGALTTRGGPVGSGISLLSAAAVDDIDYQHFWLGLGL